MAHLCGVLLTNTLGLNAKHVAYRGGGPALNDVAAGHVDLFCSSTQTATPLINGGTMKGIGVTSVEPSKTNPPAESLVTHPAVGKVMDLSFWLIMFAPKGTPADVIAKLNDAARKVIADPQVAKKFTDSGVSLYPPEQMTPQYAKSFFLGEVQRWTDFVKMNNIKAN
jgi:tripartite-type tricarboxylate transporter receptor subunit TctC